VACDHVVGPRPLDLRPKRGSGSDRKATIEPMSCLRLIMNNKPDAPPSVRHRPRVRSPKKNHLRTPAIDARRKTAAQPRPARPRTASLRALRPVGAMKSVRSRAGRVLARLRAVFAAQLVCVWPPPTDAE